jgi:MscS family membrane protein
MIPASFRIIAVLLALAVPAVAQIPGISTSQTSPAAEPVPDPLGRETPRGTILGFNLAARRNDFTSARQFMQLSAAQRGSADSVAMQLNELIDRYFSQPIAALSGSPSGSVNDGLPLDRERLQFTIDGKSVYLELVRTTDPQEGRVWLFASDTLARVPTIYRSAQGPWIEEVMPQVLVKTTLFGVSIARLLGYLASLVVPIGVMWILSIMVLKAAQKSIADPQRERSFVAWYGRLRWLVLVVLTLVVHLTLLRYLAFSLRFRFIYSRFALVAAVVASGVLLVRLLKLSFDHARSLALHRGEAGLSSLLMLTERVAKVIITLIAIFAILTIAGVDTSTALAGVGIGGIALALGAQKSVENLLGSVFLITDKALAVGDECRIADRMGRIEDITLRSVRLRTAEQTLLSIPAGVLSQSSIENFSTRNKILLQSTLRLQHETTIEQLRSILDGIRQLLEDHPRLEPSSSRIRLAAFGERAVELELFAFVVTSDVPKFLEVREELLLQIAEVVKSAGTAFARPTEFLYVDDPVVESQRTHTGTRR